MPLYNFKIIDPVTVTVSEQSFSHRIESLKNVNVYIINQGSTEMFYEILGSPSGITTNDIDNNGNSPTTSDISRQYFNIEVNNLLANTKKIVDIPRAYNFIKLTVWTNAGTTTFKYWVQYVGDTK